MLGLSMLPAHAQEKTIKLGTMAWEDILPITGVATKVLEDKGYTVEVTDFSEWGASPMRRSRAATSRC
jgi:glycine betaine/proline transport system substrate-binding protein